MDELRMHQKMSNFCNLIGWESSLSLINDLDKDKVQTNSLPLPRSFGVPTAQKLLLYSFLLPTALLATGYGFLICGRVLPSKKVCAWVTCTIDRMPEGFWANKGHWRGRFWTMGGKNSAGWLFPAVEDRFPLRNVHVVETRIRGIHEKSEKCHHIWNLKYIS